MGKFVFNIAVALLLVVVALPVQAQTEAEAEDAEAAYIEANFQYLVDDAQREGTIVRASGLQIHVIRRGDGGIAGAGQQVVVHYEGSLIDGTIFDSSYTRGQPSTFPINEIIRGWQEAMTLMTVGSKWEIVMPARLGYGSRADIDVIPNGSTLIFTVELLSVR